MQGRLFYIGEFIHTDPFGCFSKIPEDGDFKVNIPEIGIGIKHAGNTKFQVSGNDYCCFPAKSTEIYHRERGIN